MLRRLGFFTFVLSAFLIFPVLGLYLRLVVTPLTWIRRAWGVVLLNPLVRFWGVTLFGLGKLLDGGQVQVTGFAPEKAKPYLVLSNHQSIIDIALLFWVFRKTHIKFVMKKELQWGIPNVSPATRLARFAFLDRRAGLHLAEATLKPLCDALNEEKVGCVIFPEGTRSRDGKLRSFKSAGVALMARELHWDVLVVTLDGTWQAATPMDLYRHLPGFRFKIHIEPPQPMGPFREDPKAALEGVRAVMERRIQEFRK